MFLDLSNWQWCTCDSGVIKALSFIKNIINIVRWVVPIGLIGFTSYEMIKKVINPEDREFKKHITNRVIAAVIVFFVPFMITIILKIVDIGRGAGDTDGDDTRSSLEKCWNMEPCTKASTE